jgi:hypothetical protein
LPLCGREHAEAAHYHQIFDYARFDPIWTASHELVLKSHHLVADGRLGLALPASHEPLTTPPVRVRPTTKAGAAPRLYTIRGDAVTGPGSAGHPEMVPEETAQI